jgi:drug/metabolite transporter (DMT)-like permease
MPSTWKLMPTVTWVLGCAITYTIYVLLLKRYAIRHDALPLTAVQLSTVGLLGLVWVALSFSRGFPFEKLDAPLLLIIAYLGVIAVSLTTWLQTVVQRVGPAFQTAVIYSLEPVFAAIFSWWWSVRASSRRGSLVQP